MTPALQSPPEIESKPPDAWVSESHGRTVQVVRQPYEPNQNWERWALLVSDIHWDNPDCDRDLFKRHLDQAVERDAPILINGDFFCAMQGKYDKRADKSKVRPEHQVGDYLDALVRTAADFLEPYAHQIVVIGDGNHETAIRKRHETDLLGRLTAVLRDRTGCAVEHGGYTGWVKFTFKRSLRSSKTVTLWRAHGWGGGGPVTLGTIQAANRMPMMVEGADVLWSGHVHERWAAEKVRVTVNSAHRVEHKSMWVVVTSAYKDEYRDGEGGWHAETGKPPKPIGGYWLRFTSGGDDRVYTEVLPTDSRR